MNVPFLKNWRRRRLLAQPFPASWEMLLRESFPQLAELPERWQRPLRDRLRVLLADKYWEGVAGFTVTPQMQVTIAAMACVPVLAFDAHVYPNILTVLLHDRQYLRQARRQQPGGVVAEGAEWRLGEAHTAGVIGLSWPAVQAGGRQPHDGFNLVYHEFAHALDMSGGAADGVPPLDSTAEERTWANVLAEELNALRRQRGEGYAIVLDDYALTNEAEFFAVATESYLERPRLLNLKLPRLYALLDSFYRLDPIRW